MRSKVLARGLLFCCFTVLLCALCSFLEAQQGFKNSLVRVYLHRESPGVFHEGHYIPNIHIQETVELQGVIVDPRGYVVSYVGSYWHELSLSGVDARLSIETLDGVKRPAYLVGVDERIALVVLASEGLTGRALPMSEGGDGNTVQFVSFHGGDWQVMTPTVVKLTGNDPVRQLQVVPNGIGSIEGGLVLDMDDRLTGIVRRSDSHPFSGKISVWQVLSSQVIRNSVSRIVETRRDIQAGWLGIWPDFKTGHLRVARIVPGSPAVEAGVQTGDVIFAVDDQPVQNRWDLEQAIRWKGIGSELTLSVLRDGQPHELTTTLSERQDWEPRLSWRLEVPAFWNRKRRMEEQVEVYRAILPLYLNLGFIVDPLTSQLEDYVKNRVRHGLLIRNVLPGSPAGRVGFQAGDIVVEVNGLNVVPDMDTSESFQSDDGTMTIRFLRNGHSMIREFTIP